MVLFHIILNYGFGTIFVPYTLCFENSASVTCLLAVANLLSRLQKKAIEKLMTIY